MTRMLSIWATAALLALCGGGNAASEGMKLAASGYHLCVRNETKRVPYLALHTIPYTMTRPCGGWLLWKTCPVTLYKVTQQIEYKNVTKQTTRCCEGYVQVGRYCAKPLNRSGDFTAKPGSCPTADGLYPMSEGCEWDIDCAGWHKCCKTSDRYLCSRPASSASYSENGGYRFNATVTVKTDYVELMSKAGGHLNHTRLLQAMAAAALGSNVSVYFLASWPVHPYRVATSLLIDSKSPLSLDNVAPKLHLLLKHIQEISSVTVEDVDECSLSALRHCSIQARCNNTVGSYQCACRPGYVDLDPSNPGANCTADASGTTTTELLSTRPPMSTNYTPASNSTQNTQGIGTIWPFNSTETSVTTALSHTSSVAFNSSQQTQQWTGSAPYTSMSPTAESPLPTTTCSPPSITSLWSANVTGASFIVCWSNQLQTNQTYEVFVCKGSEVIHVWETEQTKMEVTGLLPGVLYTVTVTPFACESRGITLHASVRTDAQTLDATARLTNIEFTADLQNSSSQAYRNLTDSITEEIYQSLSPEVKAMVDSDQVRIEIRGFHPGSVVVNFTMVFNPSESQDISNVSTALLKSLMNSTKYTVDENNTVITDFDECASGENDCSQWATCENIWASFTCVCLDGFVDINPERRGRACAVPTSETTTSPTKPSTVSATPFSQITTTTNDPALVSAATTPGTNTVLSTSEMVSTAVSSNSMASASSSATQTAVPVTYTTTTSASTAPTTIATSAITITAPTTTSTVPPTTNDPVTTSTNLTTTTTTTLTLPTAPTIISTVSPSTTDPITTTTAPTTTSIVPSTTIHPATTTAIPLPTTAPTTMITNPITITTSPTLTSAPTNTSTAPSTDITAPLITITASTGTSTSPTTTTPNPTTTTPNPTTTTTNPTTTTTNPTTNTSNPTTTTTNPTTTTTNPTTNTSNPTTTTTNPTTTTTTTLTTVPTTNPQTNITTPTTKTTAFPTRTNASMLGAISVQCNAAAITATVARDFLLSARIRESALYLGLQECGVNGGNATHAQLTVAWNECATSLVHNETHYVASVTLFNNMDQYISDHGTLETPRIRLEVPIVCDYMKNLLISADFSSMGYDMMKDVIMASGWFQVTVQLMNGTDPLPHNYSLSPDEAVVVDVSLNPSSEQIYIILNKCWATPTQNPVDANSYTFLEDSCSLNIYTKVLTNGISSTSRLSVKIFSFVQLNVIYLHCNVQICAQIGSETCVPDCLQRTARTANIFGTAFGSSGPLRKSDEEPHEEFNTLHLVGFSCLGIGLTIIFIAGFVLLFYCQRNRIGHYNFNVKPKQENFTYLHFNT